VATGARIAEALLGSGARLVLGSRAVEILLGAVAAVRRARRDQALDVGLVHRESLGLEVRPVGPAHARAFVPVEAEPAHRVEDRLHAVLRAALAIGVFDAQDELATLLPGPEPVVQGAAGSPDVQVAGGRRRESNADLGHGAAVSTARPCCANLSREQV